MWPMWIMITAAMAWACRDDARRVMIYILAGLLAMRTIYTLTPDDWRYIASGALWVSIGIATIKRGFPLSGGALVASGLCYAVAEVYAAPQHIGQPIRVVADLFGLAAIVGVFGNDAWGNRKSGNVGGGHRRRALLACGCGHDLAARETAGQ